ncbi:hypothetical protein F6R98_13585 [Candidatus Methylospira mobilis]|uniref:Response receiver domain-containing protein n=1 Tax=Candidatus Methylospira mobilis TaxID=1808979 RepID=A0A5Q0BI77_9GAMM|nr:hypothetical protein F6R98_13585 [Candidatus Methylospira mobilis]
MLILDYHLDGNQGSEKAINILRRLAGNSNFNLVVVYTQNRSEAGAGIENTINEIALSLACPATQLKLHQGKLTSLQKKMGAWEDIQDGIFDYLLGCVDQIAFLKVLERDDRSWNAISEMPELNDLARYLNSIPQGVNLNADQVIELLMHRRQSDFCQKMSQVPYGRVTTGSNNDINWIRTDSLFITVVSKQHDPNTIPERLLDALEAWDPVPHRLIMSKMRSELDQQGVMAETGVLMNRHLHAGWLEEILESDEAKRRTSVRLNVARHWESLGGKIESSVVDFAERVAAYLSHPDHRHMMMKRFDLLGAGQQREDVCLQLNSYACSKPIEGHHLTTGHILRIDRSSSSSEYWLCLTPACDLVPGQGNDKGWKKRLGSWLPFKAVRLYSADKTPALKNASRGSHLFLQIENKLNVFGFSENAEGRDVDGQPLRWEQLFAAGNGAFNGSNQLEVAYIVDEKGILSHKKYQGVVVAQLRYEYALNLLHRLGSHLSRVGLDFIPMKSDESSG